MADPKILLLTVVAIGLLLTIILVPLTFSYIEYYEFGLKQRKTTGGVDTSTVYGKGRYNLGPDYKFLKYQADTHFEQLNSLSVFSAGGSNESIGLDFKIDVEFTFLLNKDEVGLLHQDLASSYESIIVSRAKTAIKNEAIFVTFVEYFQSRIEVETRFKVAVQKSWDDLYCTLDQFYLGRIRIPESVARKQLETKVQNERNMKEDFLQKAQVEREVTAVDVNAVYLEETKVLRTAQAEASLLRAKASAEAKKLMAEAQINGTMRLFEAANIVTQEHMTAFTYIRTITERDTVNLDVISYTENILKTKVVG